MKPVPRRASSRRAALAILTSWLATASVNGGSSPNVNKVVGLFVWPVRDPR